MTLRTSTPLVPNSRMDWLTHNNESAIAFGALRLLSGPRADAPLRDIRQSTWASDCGRTPSYSTLTLVQNETKCGLFRIKAKCLASCSPQLDVAELVAQRLYGQSHS